jgi:uncharacterized HAD superfamily protein
MRLKIGLDIDGVVADSFPVFLRELNKHYGKDITEIYDYDMSKVYDVAWEDLGDFFDQNVEYLFSAPKPMEGAVDTIHSWLGEGHEIVYITARKCGLEEEVTLKWFDQHRIPRDKTVFVGGASKTFAAKEFGVDVFIEDFMSNALEIASIGVPVLLFDAPYNRGKMPKGVTRCLNWKEVKEQVGLICQSK